MKDYVVTSDANALCCERSKNNGQPRMKMIKTKPLTTSRIVGASVCEPIPVVVEAGAVTASKGGLVFAFVPPKKGGTRLPFNPLEEVSSPSGNHDGDSRVLNDNRVGEGGTGGRVAMSSLF